MIVLLREAIKPTVVCDSRFDNLSGPEVISRVKRTMFATGWCYESGPLKVIGQFSRRDHGFFSGGSPGYLRVRMG